jgi:hypothetical protein
VKTDHKNIDRFTKITKFEKMTKNEKTSMWASALLSSLLQVEVNMDNKGESHCSHQANSSEQSQEHK